MLSLAASLVLGCNGPADDGGDDGDAYVCDGVANPLPLGFGSPWGVQAGPTLHNPAFVDAMGMLVGDYLAWATSHLESLGCNWSGAGFELRWAELQPDPAAGGFDSTTDLHPDDVVAAVYAGEQRQHWLGRFVGAQAGSGSDHDPLRWPERWAAFVRAVVERYDGNGCDDLDSNVAVRAWQLGTTLEAWRAAGLTMDQYNEWARATAAAIRQLSPEAELVAARQATVGEPSADLARVIAELVADGTLDAVDLAFVTPADEYRMTAAAEARGLLDAAGRSDARLYSLQHGTWAGSGVGLNEQSEHQQAVSLVKRFAWNLAHGIDRAAWPSLVDGPDAEGSLGAVEGALGLLADGAGSGRVDDTVGKRRRAYHSYQLLATELRLAALEGSELSVGLAGAVLLTYPADAVHSDRLLAWSDQGELDVTVPVTGAECVGQATVVDDDNQFESYGPLTPTAQGRLTIQLSQVPVLWSCSRE